MPAEQANPVQFFKGDGEVKQWDANDTTPGTMPSEMIQSAVHPRDPRREGHVDHDGDTFVPEADEAPEPVDPEAAAREAEAAEAAQAAAQAQADAMGASAEATRAPASGKRAAPPRILK